MEDKIKRRKKKSGTCFRGPKAQKMEDKIKRRKKKSGTCFRGPKAHKMEDKIKRRKKKSGTKGTQKGELNRETQGK